MRRLPDMVHPTALIDPAARVHASVEVGPYAVIEAGVAMGPDCRVGPHVHLLGGAILGARNVIHAGCVLGDAPQDLKYAGAPTTLRIGDDNVFREHVTVHRSNSLTESTVIGSGNLLMAHSHVGHNARLGDRVILANGALVGGHVTIGDRAFISGNCLLHQFVRVGALALMQGGAAISKDLPPYCIAEVRNSICGLNVVGLRRAGIDAAARLELKRVYRALFRSGQSPRSEASRWTHLPEGTPARALVEFVLTSTRGVCTHTGSDADAEV